MNWIGYLMIAIPFFALFGVIWKELGLKVALKTYGLTLIIVVWIVVGSYLITHA